MKLRKKNLRPEVLRPRPNNNNNSIIFRRPAGEYYYYYETSGTERLERAAAGETRLAHERRRCRRRDSLATSVRTRPVGGRVFRRVIFFHFPSPLPSPRPPRDTARRHVVFLASRSSARPSARPS